MTLEQVTKRLEEVLKEINEVGEKLGEMDYHYQQRKAEVTLMDVTMGYSRAEAREAAVTLTLETEGLTWPLVKQKGLWKRLATEKEVLLELSRNLRELERSKK